MSARIQMRLDQIESADTVEEMIEFHIGRCHKLVGNRKEQYAVDLIHPYRMIFTKHEGSKIQIAHILESIDYH